MEVEKTMSKDKLLQEWKEKFDELKNQKKPWGYPETLGLVFLGVSIPHFVAANWAVAFLFLGLSLCCLIYYGVTRTKYVLRRDILFARLFEIIDEIAELGEEIEEEDEIITNRSSFFSGSGGSGDNDLDDGLDDDLDDDLDEDEDDRDVFSDLLRRSEEIDLEKFKDKDADATTKSDVEKALDGEDYKLPSERGSSVIESPKFFESSVLDSVYHERVAYSSAPSYSDYGDSSGSDDW